MDLRDVISERHVVGNNEIDNNKEIIHIAFGIDENFTLGMGVLMTSILMHNGNKFIDFHIFTDRLKQIDIDRLQELSQQYTNCQIHTYYVDSNKLKKLPAWYIWTVAAWYRCLIALELQNENIEYIWYLDSDILCLNEIVNPVINDRVIMGTFGEAVLEKDADHIKRFLKNGPYKFFNTGVLYIRLIV